MTAFVYWRVLRAINNILFSKKRTPWFLRNFLEMLKARCQNA
jgi:hypothetical protein